MKTFEVLNRHYINVHDKIAQLAGAGMVKGGLFEFYSLSVVLPRLVKVFGIFLYWSVKILVESDLRKCTCSTCRSLARWDRQSEVHAGVTDFAQESYTSWQIKHVFFKRLCLVSPLYILVLAKHDLFHKFLLL